MNKNNTQSHGTAKKVQRMGAAQLLETYAPCGDPHGDCVGVSQDWENEATWLTFRDGSVICVGA